MIEPVIIIVLFLLFIAIQLWYYLFFFTKISSKKHQTEVELSGKPEAVSVIICARNERANLEANLGSFLNQDHPDFQVIIVDDGSTDGTRDFLEAAEKKYDKLKIVTLEIDDRYRRGKKFALTMGIKASKNPIILLSDADCQPNSDQWIKKMTYGLKDGKEIALGVSMFPPAKGLLSWMIRVETFHTAMQYINFALAGNPYMGVGRNLAYRKDLFFRVKGFASHQHLLSGDDDLFVNETARKENTVVIWDNDAQTTSIPQQHFSSWHKQKGRHFSTAKYYKGKDKRLLGIYSFSLFLLYVAAGFIVATGLPLIIPAIAFGTRLIVQGIVFGINLKKFNTTKLIWGYPFIDLIILYIQIFIGIKGVLSRPKTWR